MSKFYIVGGNKLNGEVIISSAKNSLLPILASCILINGEVILHNFAKYSDCQVMLKILENLGASYTYKNDSVIIKCDKINNNVIENDLAIKLRSSFFALGPILGRMKKAKVAYPGGCNIGSRPVNIHLKALRDLGVSVIERHGYIYCNAEKIKGNSIHLDFPSVGATENIIMVACLISGTTIISNCAKEPEIVDLQNFLNASGANVSGAGTDTITIVGVNSLHSVEYTCISDRIIAGTYAIATACCGGNVVLNNVNNAYLQSILNIFKVAGVNVIEKSNSLQIISNGDLKSVSNIITMPYPGFPTDLQSQILVMQSISKGNSIICENIFESRFNVVPELLKMGADIVVKNNIAYINGVECLYGADVLATDLRAGASLIIAGLIANGYSTIHNIQYIDRGYLEIEKDLALLGANIKRID